MTWHSAIKQLDILTEKVSWKYRYWKLFPKWKTINLILKRKTKINPLEIFVPVKTKIWRIVFEFTFLFCQYTGQQSGQTGIFYFGTVAKSIKPLLVPFWSGCPVRLPWPGEHDGNTKLQIVVKYNIRILVHWSM